MADKHTPRLRCAVYTRKSTEDGLDQEFNSLDAQHEACAAFIASQASLGWTLVADHYDDGGISGGTMERPALQRLLQDIRDHKVDVVVVYKIDRLTRSLTDFAKIVDVFDEAGASFVSVTQQFNTTTSMGRLTLNVLLSFAQFEREVTAERIRDKIAASKKKGMWMGGVVPFGYRVENRKLLINEKQAETVRWLFATYLHLKSVRALVEAANAAGLSNNRCLRTDHDGFGSNQSKILNLATPSDSEQDADSRPISTYPHTAPRDETVLRARSFGRGNLYHLLANPIYVGRIRHRDQIFEGEHDAIIEQTVFDKVQTLLAAQAPRRKSPTNRCQPHLLTGLLFDEAGDKLRAVHANKKGVRYRYYVSKHLVEGRRNGTDGWRLPASQIEAIVEDRLIRVLSNKAQLSEWIQQWVAHDQISAALDRADELKANCTKCRQGSRERFALFVEIVQSMVHRITLSAGNLALELDRHKIAGLLTHQKIAASTDVREAIFRIDCPIALRRRGVETRMILTDGSAPASKPDATLIDLLVRAHGILGQLTDGSGRSLTDIAKANGTDLSAISRILPLAFLAPKIVTAILEGTQPVGLTAHHLSRISHLPNSWAKQSALLDT